MEHVAYEIAKEMLDLQGMDLPPMLRSRIKRVIELVEKVNGNLGTLRSTQVVANIIMEWENG